MQTELLELERGFWRAAGDRSAYEKHLAPDALHVFPAWGIAERDQVLQGVEDAEPWTSVEIVEPRILRLGGAAAAICYRAHARRDGEPVYHAAITSVYRFDGGGWRLVVHQQTALDV